VVVNAQNERAGYEKGQGEDVFFAVFVHSRILKRDFRRAVMAY
jgi:hypothetical protein